jgi:3-oxoacyl-[acyl-carrier protein] reductase
MEILKNKIVIVTGGTRGIGRALTQKLLEKGAVVVAIHKNNSSGPEELKSLYPDKLDVIQSDVADYEQIEETLKGAKMKYGKIDAVINNAGIFKGGRMGFIYPGDIDEVIDINLKGVINVCNIVSRIMIGQKGGKIINISSISGERAFEGQSVYSATKAAVNSITKSLAKELGKYNIQVNAIAPGTVDTDMVKAFRNNNNESELINPAEIAGWILKILSDSSSLVSGQIINLEKRYSRQN